MVSSLTKINYIKTINKIKPIDFQSPLYYDFFSTLFANMTSRFYFLYDTSAFALNSFAGLLIYFLLQLPLPGQYIVIEFMFASCLYMGIIGLFLAGQSYIYLPFILVAVFILFISFVLYKNYVIDELRHNPPLVANKYREKRILERHFAKRGKLKTSKIKIQPAA
jgi:hypothetical protein